MAVRLPADPQSAHLWWPAVAKLQAASVPIDYGSCALEQTDGRVAVSLNAPPLRRGHKNAIGIITDTDVAGWRCGVQLNDVVNVDVVRRGAWR